MSLKLCTLVMGCLLMVADDACDSKPANNQTATATPPPAATPATTPVATGDKSTGACSLLTNAEVAEVQGEAVKEAVPTDKIEGAFAVAECFYRVDSFTRSVSLQVTRSSPDKQRATEPLAYWDEHIRGAKDKKKTDKPKPVAGIGDEAVWLGTSRTGALLVLKGNSYFRISIGGNDDEAAKMEKSKKLALYVLKRL